MTTVFYTAAAVAIVATVLALTRANAVHGLLYLVVSLLAVALIFFVAGAPFVAALEVVIYAGAIIVMFLFVVMLVSLGSKAIEEERRFLGASTWLGPAALASVLLVELVVVLRSLAVPLAYTSEIGPARVGATLYGPYLIAVELASLLLLSALIGAVHLGRRTLGKGDPP